MWTNALFFGALVATTVSAQHAASSDVLITMPISVDGSMKNLQLLRGETYEDAAVSFARNNGLINLEDDSKVREVVGQLSGLLKEKMQEINAAESAAAPVRQPSVQLSIPLAINGFSSDLKKFEGETVDAAVERYLYASGFSMDVMRDLYPQLLDLVNQKLKELQPPRKELFSFTLTIDGREAITRHFEQGNPMDEAEQTLRSIGFTDVDFINRLAPQIANEINKRIAEQTPLQQQPQPPVAQPPQTPPREVLSMPLTINNRNVILVHYEGMTSRESASRFLTENELTDATSVNELLPQLVQVIDTRIAELLKAEADAEAEAEAAAVAARQAEADAILQQSRQPLVRLPINLGNNQQATLEYFKGDSVERTVELFLSNVGVQSGPVFNNNVEQLSALVRAELEKIAPAEPLPTPALTLPITLAGRVFNLDYYTGQEPVYVANTFCVEKHEIIRAELGQQFDGNQLQQCKNVLVQAINDFLAREQQQQQPPTESVTQPETASPSSTRGELLFTLDIDVDGESLPLNVHMNDNAEQAAREFCQLHGIDLGNVAALAEAIQGQLSKIKPQ